MSKELAKKLLKSKKHILGPRIGKKSAEMFIKDIFELMYPHVNSTHLTTEDDYEFEISRIKLCLLRTLKTIPDQKSRQKIITKFFKNLIKIYDALKLDAEAIVAGDPAANSINEVIFSYPGFFAIFTYRISHYFYNENVPIFPRMLSEYAHQVTGVDIHPGAKIGKSFFIDHGTGIVIGETTIIKDNVKLYQGVTLGALSVSKKMASKKRHPTLENKCVVYSNATILGGETVIGEKAIIGGNVWITKSVPANSICYHKSEMALQQSKNKDLL